MKIIFHDNSLSFRGTTVALFDYAFFCKKLYNFDVTIMYNKNHPANDIETIDKFKNEFEIVQPYSSDDEMQRLILEQNPDVFFMIKHGKYDGVLSKSCKNWVLAVGPCNRGDIHGDKFFMASKWLSHVSDGIDYVPHMINLPEENDNLRKELNIPLDAIVFGRNGGFDTFDLDFVKKAVEDMVKIKNNVFFLFQGTEKFIEHPRVIFLPTSPNMVKKVQFINTTDALLHARVDGESFGLTCGEFSIKNKPVITWLLSREKNHIEILGERGIYYKDYDDLMKILLNFVPDTNKDWNCYRDYLPGPVMEIFSKLYLDK